MAGSTQNLHNDATNDLSGQQVPRSTTTTLNLQPSQSSRASNVSEISTCSSVQTTNKPSSIVLDMYSPKKLTSNSGQESDSSKRIYSHCHIREDTVRHSPKAVENSAIYRLITVSIICLIFMVAEVVGGIMSKSLAIAADAAHLLTDFASFMISLFAIWLSHRPATRQMHFGWYRAEVIGALVSILMIWVVTVYLVILAVHRIQTNDYEIESGVMLITAVAGLVVNIIMGVVLGCGGGGHHHHFGHSHHHHHDDSSHDHQTVHVNHNSSNEELEGLLTSQRQNKSRSNSYTQQVSHNEHKKENLNVRAALIHVLGDFLQSLGVLVAALVVYFKPDYKIVDPICTFLFSFLVLITTIRILKDAMNVLMEGMPEGINFIEVRDKLQHLPGVITVHNLRIWSLSAEKIAITTHLVIDSSKIEQEQALKSAINLLQSKYSFFEATVQIEKFKDDMRDCLNCQDESPNDDNGSDDD